VRRLLVIAAVLIAATVAQPAAAQLTEQTLLMPGVTYERDVEFTLHGPVVLHVITAPRPDGSLYRLAPALSNSAVVATEPLTSIEKSLSGSATVAGVNGDYFNPNPGDPKGMLMSDGALVTAPAVDRSSLGIAPDGTLQVARVTFNGIWKGNGQRRPLSLNEPPASGGSVTLYTSAWGPATPPEKAAVVEDVIPSLPQLRPNTDLFATVAQAVPNAGVAIPQGGGVLVARGSQVAVLGREAPAGTQLFLRLALAPDWSGMTSAIGGGPVIVANGKPVFRAKESFAASILNPRTSRSAVGQLADGRIVLVTVDGGGNGYSVGMTNFELGLAMMRLGAVQAMALGSGPVASMAFDGSLLSRPATGAEPQVSDALVLLYDGAYVPAPAASVISPNGDGVDDTLSLAYKVVRPSHVTAAIVGPGVREVVTDGLVDPGTRTVTFDGKGSDGAPLPEGGYRFTVTATDGGGETTTAERAFALNDTLGTLSVSPTTARLSAGNRSALTVGFTLAHPATVTAVVATRTGVVVRTLFKGALAAGPQQLVWDGRDAAGKIAFGGSYVVQVAAANSIGRVELEQAFRAERG
jgi:flagellar hook assembly protein FlgD